MQTNPNIAQTSLEAYWNRVQPTLTEREQMIFDTIRELGTATLESLADKLKRPDHTFSGRITALLKKGLIEVCGRTRNSGGNAVRVYKIK